VSESGVYQASQPTAPTLARGPAPVPSRHAIYWRETEAVDPGTPLEGDVHCDVCIVGGGYTGLWTAHFLKQADPSLDIHVLEAHYAGAGASGHNDGFVTPTVGHSLHTVIHGFGPERAKATYAAVGRSIMELRRFCLKHDVDAELEPNGFYLVATNDAQRRRLDSDGALAERMGVRYDALDGTDARSRIGSPAITGALKTAGALVNPHRLARGLCRVVRRQGVEIHEQTPAVALGRTAAGHVVGTPRGRVTAERLVLATNAYQHQWAPFRNQVKPVWSYAAVSEPLTAEQLAQVHWPGREGFVEACNFIVFGRLTAQNRLLIGGGPAPYFYGQDMDERRLRNDAVQKGLREALGRYFPPWRDLAFTHTYGGCIAVTRDLVPHVGNLGGGLYYGYGFCGNGIATTHTVGKALRDLVLARSGGYSELLFVRGREPAFPPEPLSFLGARALSALLTWQDRHPKVIKRQLI
jgi:glycine/D-amino acid oxidase-like deaminating enzyme